MSLLNKIKSLFGRGSSAQPPANPVSDHPGTPQSGNEEGSGLKNSIARGAAEGTARETVRKLFEESLGN
jgi:hypothetical protein